MPLGDELFNINNNCCTHGLYLEACTEDEVKSRGHAQPAHLLAAYFCIFLHAQF